jgi:flagellar biosynthesis protein FlhA
VSNLRRQIATDLGIVLPPVHLRDNLRLEAMQYKIKLRGNEIAGGQATPTGSWRSIPAARRRAGSTGSRQGARLRAAGALDLAADRAPRRGGGADGGGSGVGAHHPSRPRCSAATPTSSWGGRRCRSCSAPRQGGPKLVEDVVPGTISLGELVRVMRGVLREGLSVRDLRGVLEGVADAAPRSKDTAFLVEQVRRRLFRQITARVADDSGVVHALTLDRGSEDLLRKSLGRATARRRWRRTSPPRRRFVGTLEAHAAQPGAPAGPTV